MTTATAVAKTVARFALGAALVTAGTTHLTTQREAFQAQVPNWVPLPKDTVVLASGVVEIALGASLVVLTRQRRTVGRIAAAFFVAIFPGNISQMVTRTSSLGLDTDRKRQQRLLFQPVLVAWSLWSTSDPRAA